MRVGTFIRYEYESERRVVQLSNVISSTVFPCEVLVTEVKNFPIVIPKSAGTLFTLIVWAKFGPVVTTRVKIN